MKRIVLLALLSAALLPGKTMAQGNIKFEEYDLPNGLHVILHQDNSTPIAAVSVLYHVGSKNENQERTGFAHFFEHLLFEGTENIKRGEFMKLVQASGGELNANTSFDRTFYYEVLPSNKLELGLWMEAERMAYAKIDNEGLETQRKVVKEEKKMRYDNTPYGQLMPEIFKNSFTVHPYRWMPIGDDKYLDMAQLPEFIDFYKTFYVPNNATLSIAGDIDIAQTKAWINKYFGSIPKGTKPIPRPSVKEPAFGREKKVTFYDNVQLPAVALAYHAPAQGTPDAYALELLSTLLSNGKSSRLNKEVVDKQEKAVFAGAFAMPTEDPGLTMMFGIANMGVKPEELQKSIDAEIVKLQNELISEQELEKLKNQAEMNFVSQNSKVVQVAENLANYHVYYGNAGLINNELERYKKVTRQDLQNVAKKYLDANNRLVLYYLPKSEEKK